MTPVPGGTKKETEIALGLALYDVDVDGEAATRSLLVFVEHVASRDAHGVDGLVERDEVAPVAAQSDAGRVDRGDGGDRVPLDARHLDQAADRVAGQPEVVLDADLRGVLHLRRRAAEHFGERAGRHRAGRPDLALAAD